jgi:hypothetical protein
LLEKDREKRRVRHAASRQVEPTVGPAAATLAQQADWSSREADSMSSRCVEMRIRSQAGTPETSSAVAEPMASGNVCRFPQRIVYEIAIYVNARHGIATVLQMADRPRPLVGDMAPGTLPTATVERTSDLGCRPLGSPVTGGRGRCREHTLGSLARLDVGRRADVPLVTLRHRRRNEVTGSIASRVRRLALTISVG